MLLDLDNLSGEDHGVLVFFIAIFLFLPAYILYKVHKYLEERFGIKAFEYYPPSINNSLSTTKTESFGELEILITKFVLTYHDSESDWPNQIDIPIWDFKAFEELLIDRGISINRVQLRNDIEHEQYRATLSHFTKTMDSKIKDNGLLATQQDIHSISEIYLNYFDENSWILIIFTKYLENKYGSKLEPPCSLMNWIKRLMGFQHTLSNEEYIKGLLRLIRLKNEKRNRIQEMEDIISSDHKMIHRVDFDFIDIATGIEFERILSVLFQKLGYSTVVETPASGDQGADLVIAKAGQSFVVQAKRWNNRITNSAIQEVVAAKAHYKCNKAIVVTNNEFTKSAVELAHSNNVDLWDRRELAVQLNKVTIYISEIS